MSQETKGVKQGKRKKDMEKEDKEDGMLHLFRLVVIVCRQTSCFRSFLLHFRFVVR